VSIFVKDFLRKSGADLPGMGHREDFWLALFGRIWHNEVAMTE
jgi:hypothetical protein